MYYYITYILRIVPNIFQPFKLDEKSRYGSEILFKMKKKIIIHNITFSLSGKKS